MTQVAHYAEKKRAGCRQLPAVVFGGQRSSTPDLFLGSSAESAAADAIHIAPLTPHEAFMEVVQTAYKLDITDSERLRIEFENLGRVLASPLFFRLTFPRNFSLLRVVREAVQTHAVSDV